MRLNQPNVLCDKNSDSALSPDQRTDGSRGGARDNSAEDNSDAPDDTDGATEPSDRGVDNSDAPDDADGATEPSDRGEDNSDAPDDADGATEPSDRGVDNSDAPDDADGATEPSEADAEAADDELEDDDSEPAVSGDDATSLSEDDEEAAAEAADAGRGAWPPPPAGPLGGRPLFSAVEERDLIDWLAQCDALGLVITRERFTDEVHRIVQMEQRGNCTYWQIGRWVSEFVSRLSTQLSRATTFSRLLPCSPAEALRAAPAPDPWYLSVNASISARHPHADFTDPACVMYLGAINIRLDAATALVSALQLTDEQYVAHEQRHVNVAHVATVSAAGERLPAMWVIPELGAVRDDWRPGEALLQTTADGRLNSTALMCYLLRVVEPFLRDQRRRRQRREAPETPRAPVLLYVDGLNSHCSMAVSQYCEDERLMLVGLPPGANALNPLQAAVGSLLGANLDRLVAEARQGRRRDSQGRMTASLSHLLNGFAQATRRCCTETVRQAFSSSGLFPWSEAVVAACQKGERLVHAAQTYSVRRTSGSGSRRSSASTPEPGSARRRPAATAAQKVVAAADRVGGSGDTGGGAGCAKRAADDVRPNSPAAAAAAKLASKEKTRKESERTQMPKRKSAQNDLVLRRGLKNSRISTDTEGTLSPAPKKPSLRRDSLATESNVRPHIAASHASTPRSGSASSAETTCTVSKRYPRVTLTNVAAEAAKLVSPAVQSKQKTSPSGDTRVAQIQRRRSPAARHKHAVHTSGGDGQRPSRDSEEHAAGLGASPASAGRIGADWRRDSEPGRPVQRLRCSWSPVDVVHEPGTDHEITIKMEAPSPAHTPSDPLPDDPPSWADPGGGDADEEGEDEADPVVLPQARLTDYLRSLDAAESALCRQPHFANVIMELKSKLHALHSASSRLQPPPPPLRPVSGTAARSAAFAPAVAVAAGGISTPPCVPQYGVVKAVPGANEVSTRRGIKRPRRFDDYHWDDPFKGKTPPLVKTEAPPEVGAGPRRLEAAVVETGGGGTDAGLGRGSAVSEAPPPPAVNGRMEELANKQPAALKAIIGILRQENRALRARLELLERRGHALTSGVAALLEDYQRTGAE